MSMRRRTGTGRQGPAAERLHSRHQPGRQQPGTRSDRSPRRAAVWKPGPRTGEAIRLGIGMVTDRADSPLAAAGEGRDRQGRQVPTTEPAHADRNAIWGLDKAFEATQEAGRSHRNDTAAEPGPDLRLSARTARQGLNASSMRGASMPTETRGRFPATQLPTRDPGRQKTPASFDMPLPPAASDGATVIDTAGKPGDHRGAAYHAASAVRRGLLLRPPPGTKVNRQAVPTGPVHGLPDRRAIGPRWMQPVAPLPRVRHRVRSPSPAALHRQGTAEFRSRKPPMHPRRGHRRRRRLIPLRARVQPAAAKPAAGLAAATAGPGNARANTPTTCRPRHPQLPGTGDAGCTGGRGGCGGHAATRRTDRITGRRAPATASDGLTSGRRACPGVPDTISGTKPHATGRAEPPPRPRVPRRPDQ